MSNQNFDRLCKALEVRNAKDALAAYEAAALRTDLSEQERDYLARAIPGTKKRLENARANARNLVS